MSSQPGPTAIGRPTFNLNISPPAPPTNLLRSLIWLQGLFLPQHLLCAGVFFASIQPEDDALQIILTLAKRNLATIYLGSISLWNDPAISQLNPDLEKILILGVDLRTPIPDVVRNGGSLCPRITPANSEKSTVRPDLAPYLPNATIVIQEANQVTNTNGFPYPTV